MRAPIRALVCVAALALIASTCGSDDPLDNSALVSWLERVGDRAEVRVRRVYANGRKGGARTIATSSAERASGFPHMIWRGKDVVFAWTEPGRPSNVKAALLELK